MLGPVVHGATSAQAASSLLSALITRESKRFRRPAPTRTGPRTRRPPASPGVNLGRNSSGHLRPGRRSAAGATARVARGELGSHALGSSAHRAAALGGVRAAALTRWRSWRSIGASASPGTGSRLGPSRGCAPPGPRSALGRGLHMGARDAQDARAGQGALPGPRLPCVGLLALLQLLHAAGPVPGGHHVETAPGNLCYAPAVSR